MIRKVYYGWWMVFLGLAIAAYGGATIWYGFTAFFGPLVDEFAWSYTAISLAASIRGIESGLMDIVVGFLIDRFNIRWVVLFGLTLIGTGWMILSSVTSLSIFYVSFFIISAGASGISSIVFLTLLTRWFQQRLGLAIGITMSGFGIGGIAVPGIVYLIDSHGFRVVFLLFGVAGIVIGIISALLIRNRPGAADLGSEAFFSAPQVYHPDIAKPDIPVTSSLQGDYTYKKALSTFAFWVISYVNIASAFAVMMASTHIMPYLENLGYSRYTASFMAMVIPLVSIFGRLLSGWLADKTAYRMLLMVALVIQLAGVLLFLYSDIFFLLVVSVVFLGATYGSVIVLRPIALRRCYGITNIGLIMGLCMALTMTGNTTGPLVAGWLFDKMGTYDLAWYIAAALILVGITLVAIMRQPADE